MQSIPMSAPDITHEEIDAVNAVMQTRHLSIGPQIIQFENALAAYCGRAYGIGVNSGTSGLHLAVIAAGIQAGDEVITSSFSFVATANAVLYERATPIFADIDPETGNIDPKAIEAKITPRTKAILPVHVFGQPADMDPIIAIARKHGLSIIEDACESIGAEYKARRVGTFGDSAVFAFYPNKQMTTGEGGMILTDQEDHARLFRSLRNQGRDIFDGWLTHTRLGYNYRLDELSAALGLVQTRRLDELLAKRERVAQWYNERIDTITGVEKLQRSATTTRMSWFVYVVRCADDLNRNALMHSLETHNIPSRPYFTPIHLQPFYREQFGYKSGMLPHTENAGERFLALPFSSIMTEDQVDYVCKCVRIGVGADVRVR